jgi:hypothetical protein
MRYQPQPLTLPIRALPAHRPFGKRSF